MKLIWSCYIGWLFYLPFSSWLHLVKKHAQPWMDRHIQDVDASGLQVLKPARIKCSRTSVKLCNVHLFSYRRVWNPTLNPCLLNLLPGIESWFIITLTLTITKTEVSWLRKQHFDTSIHESLSVLHLQDSFCFCFPVLYSIHVVFYLSHPLKNEPMWCDVESLRESCFFWKKIYQNSSLLKH